MQRLVKDKDWGNAMFQSPPLFFWGGPGKGKCCVDTGGTEAYTVFVCQLEVPEMFKRIPYGLPKFPTGRMRESQRGRERGLPFRCLLPSRSIFSCTRECGQVGSPTVISKWYKPYELSFLPFFSRGSRIDRKAAS